MSVSRLPAFESGTDGWTDKSATSPGWQNQPPGDASSQAMAVSPYQQNTTYSLVSPKMTLPDRSSVKVTWAERRDTEKCCDFLALQWSSDGVVWTTAESIDGQNPDFPNFTAVNTTFVAPKGDLYLRFVLTSDQLVATPPYTGVAVDNVQVQR